MDPAVLVKSVLKNVSQNATAIDIIRQITYLTGTDHPKSLYVLGEIVRMSESVLDPDVLRQLRMLMNEGLVHLIAEEIYAASKPRCCGLL
ncbi:hypothetical protein [Yellowstone lake phycodnavirus 3]|uniref:hypothetical protein n=1 Tax=Yellowstone lake phycodnavirus 3 TaxID=1586715 RepID=UPI0006EBA9CE|nr:hypothetical protein AR677_gp149 [Yellowstone lake phycodnavirus 3]BAT22648.1 hypothetical protein [Yellowstone lake phycodnavirus 3]